MTFRGVEGNALAATVWGEGGRPVLLLHGGGQTRQAFAGAARRIAEAGYVAVTVDQRGHGESEWVASGRYGFEEFGRDAAALAEQAARQWGETPVAVGASLGGIASLLALGHEPGVFAGLVLVDVTPRIDPEGVGRILGFMKSHVREGFATVEEAADAVAAYLPHRPRPKSLEGLKKNLRLGEDGRWRWHWDPRFMEDHAGPERGAALQEELIRATRSLAVPSLLVRGGASELVREEHAREYLALARDAEMADIAGARHMVAGDRNDVFTQAILDFLTRRFPTRKVA
nr:alpha/beta hydrolase [Alsobacter ponti]